jgi:hypothetical protein
VTDEPEHHIHVHPAFGWGCLAAVLTMLVMMRGCL